MIQDRPGQSFSSRIRQSILHADWCRMVKRLSAEELLRFSDNPLFAINAVAAEFGCELSSVHWQDVVEFRFAKRYGRDKTILKVPVNPNDFANPPRLEAVLRATLPKQVAVANDKNTIRVYFGPAASR